MQTLLQLAIKKIKSFDSEKIPNHLFRMLREFWWNEYKKNFVYCGGLYGFGWLKYHSDKRKHKYHTDKRKHIYRRCDPICHFCMREYFNKF